MPARQPHLVQDALVALTAHKAVKRRKGSGSQKFEVTERPERKLDGRKIVCFPQKFIALFITGKQSNQFAGVRRD